MSIVVQAWIEKIGFEKWNEKLKFACAELEAGMFTFVETVNGGGLTSDAIGETCKQLEESLVLYKKQVCGVEGASDECNW